MFTLHIHSNYSLLQGAITIDELIAFAKQQDSTYVALTDTNGMYGLIPFAKKAMEIGIKPILGALIDDISDKNLSAVFLSKNNSGYSELCKIITSRKLKEDFSLSEIINTVSDNLFILTSSLNLLTQITLSPLVKKNLYVELIVTKKLKNKTRKLYNFAKINNLQIIASHPAYFLRKEDYILHKTLVAIKKNSTLDNLNEDDLADEEGYLKTSAEMRETWKALPEAIRNSEYVAQNCNVDLKFGEYKFPVFSLPSNETAFSYLWKIAFLGLKERYRQITERVVKRLQYELEVIDELGFTDYFLIVWDIVREAKNRNIITIGRGSAADSLAAYCLGLTQVDPVEHNRSEERRVGKECRSRWSPYH